MAAIDTLLVDRGPGETRIAAMAGDQVIEVHHYRHGDPGAGAVYRGRAGKALPDASAVFVEIGLDRPALMPCGGKPPPEGRFVTVRIVQPPRGEKGAKVALAESAKASVSAPPSGPGKGPGTGPGVIIPAQHPVAWCAGVYADSLSRAIVSPHDGDGVMAAMVGPGVSVDPWQDPGALFEAFDVDTAIEQALEPNVPFAGGGKLIIEPTAALTAVDVDAGPMPAAKANEVAVDTLARELRLRVIAGPVIVDLIPSRNRAALVERLSQAVAADPVPTRVSGLTPEGRIELNRRRLRPSLTDLLLDGPLSAVPSVEAVAYGALRHGVRGGLKAKSARLSLRAHADVVALLQGRLRPALDEAESVLKMPITLESAPGLRRDKTEIIT